MKIGNVNFGARLDKNTSDFIQTAREKGLNTSEMELLMKTVVPQEKIETSKNKDGFLAMGMGKYPGGYSLQTLLEPRLLYSLSKDGVKFLPYEINQETVDTITQNLKELQKNESMHIYPKIYVEELRRRYGKSIEF